MKLRPLFRLCLGTFTLLTCALTAQAAPLGTSCVAGPQPAASLLLPYFEVDLADTNGATTLMSIGNRSQESTLARVVLWSDWAIPVYAFDLLLPAQGIQTLNLRDVIARGNIPTTGGEVEPVGACASPLENPPLDAPALAELHAQLTGQPSTVDGLCWGSDRGETSVAVGYVTVDVLTDCSTTVRYPSDEGYFADDGTGLAAYDNVLYGDWFLIDPTKDLAQGAELVHLVADPAFFEDKTVPSFYRIYTDDNPKADARVPLSSRWQARYLKGGGFDGGTEFLFWHEPISPSAPVTCGQSPFDCISSDLVFFASTEAGEGSLFRSITPDGNARRVHIDSLEVFNTSGLLDIRGGIGCCVCSPPFGFANIQSWVIPLFSAADRFSVGGGAIRVDDLCVEP